MVKDHSDSEKRNPLLSHGLFFLINSKGSFMKKLNALFNDTFNTFYLWLYGTGLMVTDYLHRKKGNPLPSHGLLFLVNSKGSFMKEENALFNDALNTFYLWLYSIRHMVKYHSDSQRGNLLSPPGLLFPISSKGSFICTIPHLALCTNKAM